jgi:[ribosomal protein S5]-alanine N-acetyltransferase
VIPEKVKGDKGISLLPLRPEHVGAEYVKWLNDPEAVRYTEVSGNHIVDTTKDYVLESNLSQRSAMWRICVDDDSHIGNIRLSNINLRHGRAEVALLVGRKEYWGKGIGTKAISLVSSYAFTKMGLDKLSAGMIVGNVGSFRAFLKAGYEHEATLKKHVISENAREDVFLVCKFATAPEHV